MAFLDFLKKKGKTDESLDVPPMPPIGLGKKEIPEPRISEEEFPPEQEKIMDLPPLPDISERLAEFPTSPLKEEVKPEEHKIKVFGESKKEKISKPIFLGVDSFKNVLDDINYIKTKLRDFENVLAGVDEGKDNLYGKWKNNLTDIQKKLKFVDENLFKG